MSMAMKDVTPTLPRGSSVKQVATALGVSPGFVRLEIARNRLKAHRLGRRIVILREDVDNWLATGDGGRR